MWWLALLRCDLTWRCGDGNDGQCAAVVMAADAAGSTVCDSCRGWAGGDAECDGIAAIVTNGTLTCKPPQSSGATHGNTRVCRQHTNVNAHTAVVSVTEATVSATRRAVTTHTTSCTVMTTSCPHTRVIITTHKNTTQASPADGVSLQWPQATLSALQSFWAFACVFFYLYTCQKIRDPEMLF